MTERCGTALVVEIAPPRQGSYILQYDQDEENTSAYYMYASALGFFESFYANDGSA
jgi:hypothetical protein